MSDPFQSHSSGLESPATGWFSVTLADADLAIVPRSIDCIGSGNVDIEDAAGNTITVTLTAGMPYPVRPVRVKAPSSGSAATGVVGLY
jgi:hypothetical protein